MGIESEGAEMTLAEARLIAEEMRHSTALISEEILALDVLLAATKPEPIPTHCTLPYVPGETCPGCGWHFPALPSKPSKGRRAAVEADAPPRERCDLCWSNWAVTGHAIGCPRSTTAAADTGGAT